MSEQRPAIQVWIADVPDGVAPGDIALLDEREARRLAAFRDRTLAARYAGARAAIRRTVAAWLKVAPMDLAWGNGRCPGCGDPHHGPPSIRYPPTDWLVSVSRSERWWMLALSPGTPVGIDIEVRERQVATPAVLRRCLSRTERAYVTAAPQGTAQIDALTRCWVRKEAVVKGWGVGIWTDLAAVEVWPGPAGALVPRRTAAGAESWQVSDIDAGSDCLAALAHPAGRIPLITLHLGDPSI